jgi:hypothetical protein
VEDIRDSYEIGILKDEKIWVSAEHGRIEMSDGPAFCRPFKGAGSDLIGVILYKMKCIFKKIFVRKLRKNCSRLF